MKRLIILFAMVAMAFGQGEKLKFSEFRLGGLLPADAENGLYLSISTGALFDANLGYTIELGYYDHTYKKQERVRDVDNQQTLVSTELEQSTTYIPVMAKFNFVRDLTDALLIKADLGIGYGFVWNSEENFVEASSDSRFFSGFIWQLGADAGLQISSTGSIYLGVFYNGGSPTGDAGEQDGLPVFTEKDMSGIGYRATIRIDGFGLF